ADSHTKHWEPGKSTPEQGARRHPSSPSGQEEQSRRRSGLNDFNSEKKDLESCSRHLTEAATQTGHAETCRRAEFHANSILGTSWLPCSGSLEAGEGKSAEVGKLQRFQSTEAMHFYKGAAALSSARERKISTPAESSFEQSIGICSKEPSSQTHWPSRAPTAMPAFSQPPLQPPLLAAASSERAQSPRRTPSCREAPATCCKVELRSADRRRRSQQSMSAAAAAAPCAAVVPPPAGPLQQRAQLLAVLWPLRRSSIASDPVILMMDVHQPAHALDPKYLYHAFVCYHASDRQWALGLVKRLEAEPTATASAYDMRDFNRLPLSQHPERRLLGDAEPARHPAQRPLAGARGCPAARLPAAGQRKRKIIPVTLGDALELPDLIKPLTVLSANHRNFFDRLLLTLKHENIVLSDSSTTLWSVMSHSAGSENGHLLVLARGRLTGQWGARPSSATPWSTPGTSRRWTWSTPSGGELLRHWPLQHRSLKSAQLSRRWIDVELGGQAERREAGKQAAGICDGCSVLQCSTGAAGGDGQADPACPMQIQHLLQTSPSSGCWAGRGGRYWLGKGVWAGPSNGDKEKMKRFSAADLHAMMSCIFSDGQRLDWRLSRLPSLAFLALLLLWILAILGALLLLRKPANSCVWGLCAAAVMLLVGYFIRWRAYNFHKEEVSSRSELPCRQQNLPGTRWQQTNAIRPASSSRSLLGSQIHFSIRQPPLTFPEIKGAAQQAGRLGGKRLPQ
uniref:CKK domain-containing protein n=1 Tax=Macrostomum lignano TaxID=282301 RepID=A0A1I8FQZ1_9PLAT